MDINRTLKILLNLGIFIGVIVVVFVMGSANIFSQDYLTWGILILVVVIMVVSIAYSAWANKRRKETLQQTSTEIGFTFVPEDKELSNQLLSSASFDLFSKGRGRKAYNLLIGQRRDAKATIFDYKYTTGGGRNSHTYHQTAVLFSLDGNDLAQFNLRPRGLFDKVAAKLGQKEIDFSTAAEFTKKYLVKGTDEMAVHRVFNPSVVAFFEGQQGLTVEANEKQLLVYRQAKRIKPEELQAFLENAAQLLALIRKPSIDFGYRS
jgi:hypothetical protein